MKENVMLQKYLLRPMKSKMHEDMTPVSKNV